MPKITAHSGDTYRILHSDFLAFKEVGTDKKKYNQLISFSLIGYESDVDKVLKKRGGLEVDYEDGGEEHTFILKNLQNYEVEKQKGTGLHTRYIITRKVDRMLKKSDEDKERRSYPIVTIDPKNRHMLEDLVYRYVKGQVTFGMMNVVTEPILMARELMVDVEMAKRVLSVINKTSSEKVPRAIMGRAKKLLKWYQEWKSYLYTEMNNLHLIRKVQVKYSRYPVEMYEIVVDEEKLRTAISRGLKSKAIVFSEAKESGSRYDKFDSYMPAFAQTFKEIIANISAPKHRNGNIREKTQEIFDMLRRTPLDGQKDPMEAALKSLMETGKVNFVGECGTGKTFQMTGTAFGDARYTNQTMKLLIFCPDTLVNTVWKDEIKETLHDCEVHVVKSINDLIAFEKDGLFDDTQDRAFILSQGVAKSNYTMRPAVHWSRAKKVFKCMCCGQTVMKKIQNPEHKKNPGVPKYIKVPVDFDHFKSQRYNNYKCKNCSEVLWQPNNRNASSYKEFVTGFQDRSKQDSFVYINGEIKGYYPRDKRPVKSMLSYLVNEHNKATGQKEQDKYKRLIEEYRNLEMTIDGKLAEGRKIQPYQVSVAQYIFKKMRGKFTHLIIDEFHEFQGESARSAACSKLIATIPKVITGTGTAMNGYAKSRFFTDFMMYPEKLKKAGFTIEDQEKYQVAFGVTEKRFRVVMKDGKKKRETLTPRARPGISPIIFPLFMQDTTVFVSLNDLRKDLPPLRHMQIEVDIDPMLANAKKELEKNIRDKTKGNMKLFKGTLPIMYSFLDMPTVEKKFEDKNGNVIVQTPKVPVHADNKLKELIQVVKNEVVNEDRKMIVYTYYTNDGINEYLQEHLQNEGFRVTVLNKQEDVSRSCDGTERKVKKEDREVYIREEVAKGTEVLIVNPELVSTGYNLIDFSTILYYQMSYQLYTNRQADRRTWRIGQKRDCKIIYLYYKESMQAEIASLMATKIVASQAIEGNMDSGGLKAITQSRTAEEELAEKFFEGIKS